MPQPFKIFPFLTPDPSASMQQQQPSGPRTLHVYIQGFTRRKVTIVDSDKQTQLYSLKISSNSFSSSPDIAFHRGSSDTLIGTAIFRKFSRTIDLQFYSSPLSSIPVAMTAPSLFTRSLNFESSIGPLTWKGSGVFSRNFILIKSQNEECVARFTRKNFSMSRWGNFELAPMFATAVQKLLDEIVVSGIAIAETQRREEGS